uniref:Wzz/FepE/Etk N-terminal domain-containing protein n=1 Tax=Aquipuribacter hungaricus TaxID=545624 RepID=UPI0030EC41D6
MSADRFDPVLALARGWWLVLLCAALVAAVLGLGLTQVDPVYRSSTTLLVSSVDPTAVLTGSSQGGGDVVRSINTQARVVLSDAVTERAADDLGLRPRDVREAVTVGVEEQTDVLVVSATAGTPEQAQTVAAGVTAAYLDIGQESAVAPLLAQADALQATAVQLQGQVGAVPLQEDGTPDPRAVALAEEVASLAQQEARLRAAADLATGQVSVLTAADLPESPSSVGPRSGAAVGAVLGGALGVMLALLRGWTSARAGQRQGPWWRPRRPGSDDGPGARAPAPGAAAGR